MKSAALEIIIYGCWPSSMEFHNPYLDDEVEMQLIGLDIEENSKPLKIDLVAWMSHQIVNLNWMGLELEYHPVFRVFPRCWAAE